jgi:regulation of enolase protein 1 (concanavalin A-like superfamily)
MQYRAATGGESANAALAAGTAPEWLRLTRSGNAFTAYASEDNLTWRVLGSATVPMGANVYVGLPVTSHLNSVATTATFDNISLTP